jgi:cyclopropane fatty-acyl-phospholipid synthase-like methyltransferase
MFRLIEIKIVEPILSLLRPFFKSEESYYATVMNFRASLRRIFGRTPTASPESSRREATYYLGKMGDHVRLLEYGCGNCGLGIHLMRVLPPEHYVGCDISSGVIKRAREILPGSLVQEKCPNIHHFGSLDELNKILGDSSFDVILLNSVFTHLSSEKIVECLRFFKSILARDGFVIGDFSVPRGEVRSFNMRNVDFYYSLQDIESFAMEVGASVQRFDDFDINQSLVYVSKIMKFKFDDED